MKTQSSASRPSHSQRPATRCLFRISRPILFLLAGLIMAGCASRAPSGGGGSGNGEKQEYDLRRLYWGMNQEQILDAEKARLAYQDGQLMVYSTSILDRQMSVEYHLGQDQLYQAVYRLSESYLMEAKYIKDYNDFKAVLGKKYGPALRDDMEWHKPHFKSDPSQWGTAVSIGDLSCHASWETPRTKIDLVLSGGSYNVQCTITYFSKELAHLAYSRAGDGEAPKQSGKTDKRLKKAMDEF